MLTRIRVFVFTRLRVHHRRPYSRVLGWMPIGSECGGDYCVQYTSYRFWKSPWFVLPMLVGSLQIFMTMAVIVTAMMFPSSRQSLLEITITVSLLSWYALRQLHQLVFRRHAHATDDGNAADAIDREGRGGGGNDTRSNSSTGTRSSSRAVQEEMDADEVTQSRNDIFTCFGILGPRRKKKPKST